MQSVEEFMREYFHARSVEERKYQEGRLPFRKRFFVKDCWYDSRADTLRRMESERIVSVEDGESNSAVITEQVLGDSKGVKVMRFRYHLQAVDSNWLIGEVLIGCVVCGGHGDSKCPYCKGKQWLSRGQPQF